MATVVNTNDNFAGKQACYIVNVPNQKTVESKEQGVVLQISQPSTEKLGRQAVAYIQQAGFILQATTSSQQTLPVSQSNPTVQAVVSASKSPGSLIAPRPLQTPRLVLQHQPMTQALLSPTTSFEAQEAGRSVKNGNEPAEHICHKCCAAFLVAADLREHTTNHRHSELKRYICGMCLEELESLQDMMMHMKPIVCNKCDVVIPCVKHARIHTKCHGTTLTIVKHATNSNATSMSSLPSTVTTQSTTDMRSTVSILPKMVKTTTAMSYCQNNTTLPSSSDSTQSTPILYKGTPAFLTSVGSLTTVTTQSVQNPMQSKTSLHPASTILSTTNLMKPNVLAAANHNNTVKSSLQANSFMAKGNTETRVSTNCYAVKPHPTLANIQQADSVSSAKLSMLRATTRSNPATASDSSTDVAMTKAKPFTCEECGQTYQYLNHLTNHMKTHTGTSWHRYFARGEYNGIINGFPLSSPRSVAWGGGFWVFVCM